MHLFQTGDRNHLDVLRHNNGHIHPKVQRVLETQFFQPPDVTRPVYQTMSEMDSGLAPTDGLLQKFGCY
jgi:hypothetical protein